MYISTITISTSGSYHSYDQSTLITLFMRQSILDLSKFLAKNGLPDKERSPELLQQYITVDNFDELRSKISDQEFKDILYAIKVLFKLD